MNAFEFVQPGSIDETLTVIAGTDEQDVQLWGGGTAITLMMKQGLIAPSRLVGLHRVEALRGISRLPDGGMRIGAGTRIRDLERSDLLRAVLPCLAETASGIGNVRVRNAATVGGHLVHADPAQDLPPLLMVLDAEVHLRSRDGERTIPIAEFFVDTMLTAITPGELLTEVTVSGAALAWRSRYVKFTPRSRDDYGTLGVACSLSLAADGRTCQAARIAVGGAGPIARRFPDAEALLVGQAVTPELCGQAAVVVAEQVEPWDDARGTAAYKRAMSRVWTERTLLALV